MTNMIATIDGATAVDGLSGGLGGPADMKMFGGIRELPSAILVGAATANAEGYRPANPSPESQRRRSDAGLPERAAIAIVTSSLRLDPTLPLLCEPGYRPLILTTQQAPPDRRASLEEKADIVEVGEDRVDLTEALAELGRRGHTVILAEGGPSLNGQLIADDLIDEWNATISPLLVSGESARAAHGPAAPAPQRFTLDRLWLGDDLLFGRWLRPARQAGQ